MANKDYHYPGVGDFKLSQYVLGHVILSHRVDNEVLISR